LPIRLSKLISAGYKLAVTKNKKKYVNPATADVYPKSLMMVGAVYTKP
jgi:hypothetical protein